MRRAAIIGGLVLAVLAVSFAVSLRPLPAPSRPSPSASPTQTPGPNPLSIDAVRRHAVVGSQITAVRALAPRGGCTTSVVSYVSDGLTEYALLQLPTSTKPAAGYPVIILAHGYINPDLYQTTGSDYQGFMNAFCGAGYAMLKPDYRGNGSSQGSPSVGDLEPGYSYDLLNLTASLPHLPAVDAARVVWLGHSMGGAVVLRVAVASHKLPVKAVVLASGVVGSLSDIVENWPSSMLPTDLVPVKASLIKQYGSPESNPGFYHDVSAINYVDALTAPVEITYGSADAIVPVRFSQQLDAALTAGHKPHTTLVYPGGDHQYSTAGSGSKFIASTLEFLHQQLQ